MAINSRRKGAKNERDAAKVISEWTGRPFAKTPASGGLHWKKSFVAGDIVCTKEGHFFPFCIECKFYVKIDFSHLLNPKVENPDILDFWKQAQRDAKEAGKLPMLMMRYNGLPKYFYFLVFASEDYSALQKERMFDFMNHVNTTMTFWDKKAGIKLTLVPSTEFFKLDYNRIKKTAKTLLKNAARRK